MAQTEEHQIHKRLQEIDERTIRLEEQVAAIRKLMEIHNEQTQKIGNDINGVEKRVTKNESNWATITNSVKFLSFVATLCSISYIIYRVTRGG